MEKEKYCPKCDGQLEVEKEKEIDYPYVCKDCDENFYEFETIKIKLKLNKMKLELDEQELDYLTMVIEQNLEDVNETEEDTLHFEMLEDLYSKLIVLTKTK